MTYASRLTAHAALVLALAAAACSGTNTLGPENQLEVTNNPGSFQIQATALNDIKQTLVYQWENAATTANVNQSGSLSGTATLTIEDADGTQVYTRTLTETGTLATDAGTAGTWLIRVVLDGTSGALNFRVQSP